MQHKIPKKKINTKKIISQRKYEGITSRKKTINKCNVFTKSEDIRNRLGIINAKVLTILLLTSKQTKRKKLKKYL